MKITKAIIDNFCSIKHSEIIPGRFNVFVGQNNHGKTNLFEAISWFYMGKGAIDEIRFGRTGNSEVSVELEFNGVQEALLKMKNEKNRASIQRVVGDSDTIRARRSSNEPKIRSIFDEKTNKWTDKNPTGFDTAFNDFLPVFEYVDTATRLNDVAKYGKTTAVGNMLSAVLMALLEKSDRYRAFRQTFDDLFTAQDSEVRIELDKISSEVTVYITKQFPDCMKVMFQIAEPAFEELLKGCTTEVDDGVLTDASEKGDGMQRALMLAILQTYADFRKKDEAKGKDFLFFIDEAELHLHPTAQRNLKDALKDIAQNGDQVFINTHSSVLVVDDFEGQKIFKVEKIEKISSLRPVTRRNKHEVIYELLGGSPADLLLPHNFLIVEGRSDYMFIKSVIARFYLDRPDIQIVFSEGDFEKQRKSMDSINSLFAPLAINQIYRDRLAILCDAPKPERHADFEIFKRNYQFLEAQNQLHILPTGSLEEYYPGEFKKTAEEANELGRQVGMKRELANHVAAQITQRQFEDEMPVIKRALEHCWLNAYS